MNDEQRKIIANLLYRLDDNGIVNLYFHLGEPHGNSGLGEALLEVYKLIGQKCPYSNE